MRRAPLHSPSRPLRDLQLLILRTATALGRNPGDDLVGIHDVAGLAVEAVREVEEGNFATAVGRRLRLVDAGRAEMETGVPVLLGAARDTGLRIDDQQVCRLDRKSTRLNSSHSS